MQRSVSESLVLSASLAVLVAACGGGGGGGGGGGSPPPPVDANAAPATLGLRSAIAGAGSAKLAWCGLDAAGVPVPVALFGATDAGAVYAGAPLHTATGSGALSFAGLPDGVERYYGLAVALGGGQFAPVGTLARVVPGAPLHVDAGSTAAAPDGLTPASAFRAPIDAVLAAIARGGGNVWVAAGTYDDVALPLQPGVRVYGGFDASFDLSMRDPATQRTILRGRAGAAVADITLGGEGAQLDGLEIDGRGLAPFGVDVEETRAELRSLTVSNCAGRGLRLRSVSLSDATTVKLLGCKVSSNGAEGVSVDGAFDLTVEGSRFASNAHEGFDCDGLLGPDGVPVSLTVRGSVFADNGQEGLDCDLVPPLAPGAGGGRYALTIEGSSFEGNGRAGLPSGSAGLNLDIDFELVPDWRANIVVRGCSARANRGAGLQLDLDSHATVLLHRVLSSANGGDGLRVTSESTPSFASVSASAFLGNGGLGVSVALGQVPVVLSHCVVSGNALGGVASSTLPSAAGSSVAWLQPAPWSGVESSFNVTADNPLDPPFERTPLAFGRALSFDGTWLALADASFLQLGDAVELGDDGVGRSVVSLGAGQRVQLDPAPVAPPVPCGLARFELPGNVEEDWRLTPSSPAAAAGLPTPGGPLDAGPFGGPSGGRPGREATPLPALFFAASSTPAAGQSLGAAAQLRVAFRGGALDAASVSSQTVRVRGPAGTLLNVNALGQAGELVVDPPAGGWPSGALALELLPGLASDAGTPLCAALALPFRVP